MPSPRNIPEESESTIADHVNWSCDGSRDSNGTSQSRETTSEQAGLYEYDFMLLISFSLDG